MSNLTTKAASGLSWTVVSASFTLVMQLTYTAVMAQILSPSDFGIMTLAMSIVTFGGMFTNMGIGKAIVQKEQILTTDIRAALTSNLVLGSSLYLIIFFTSPYLALIFVQKTDDMVVAELAHSGFITAQLIKFDYLTQISNSRLLTSQVLRLVSIALVVSAISAVSINLLRRDMRFKAVSIINFTAFFIGYLFVGIGMAASGFGVWSLACAGLSQGIITATLAYIMVRHSIVPTFLWKHFKPLLAYGSKVTINTLIEYVSDNVNTYLISPFFGMASLGIYSQGRKLIFLPIHVLIANVHRVIFPAFSRLNTNPKKLKEAYLTTLTMVTLFLAPVAVGMSVAAREIVLTIYGEKWVDAIIILQIFCYSILLRYIVLFASTVCDAIAKLNVKMFINLTWLILGFVGFFALMSFGLPGLAYSVLIGEIVCSILYMWLMKRYLDVSLLDFIKAYTPGVVTALIVGLAIYGTTVLMSWSNLPTGVVVITQIIAGGLALGIKVVLFPGNILKEKILFFLDKLNVKKIQHPLVKRVYTIYLNYLGVASQQPASIP